MCLGKVLLHSPRRAPTSGHFCCPKQARLKKHEKVFIYQSFSPRLCVCYVKSCQSPNHRNQAQARISHSAIRSSPQRVRSLFRDAEAGSNSASSSAFRPASLR
jgi:hypothetical protein